MASDTVPGQLDEITERIKHGETQRELLAAKIDYMSARLDTGDQRMRFIESSLAENTAVTRAIGDKVESAVGQLTDAAGTLKDIRDAQVAGRVAKKVIAWTGGIAGGIAGIYTAWQSFPKH